MPGAHVKPEHHLSHDRFSFVSFYDIRRVSSLSRPLLVDSLAIRTSFIGVEGKNSIIIIKDNEYHLISYKDEKQVKTFEVVKKAPITARELADLEGIEINSASNRLYRLYKNGLAFRSEKVESDGKSYLYYL